MYQAVQVAVRIFNLGVYIYVINTSVSITTPTNTTSGNATSGNATFTYIIMIGNPTFDITILSIMAGVQIYIFWYVNKYYQLLPTEEETLRIEHAQLGSQLGRL